MKRVAGLLIMVAVCAAVRIWLIANTEVIAKDGAIYVQMARRWAVEPGQVVGDYDYHIGYPVVLAGVHRVLIAAGWPDNLQSWDLSGQVVSLLASLTAMVAVWLFAGMTFNWRIAFISTILFGVGRKWATLGADVISDALAVCLQIWAVVLTLMVLRLLQRKSNWAVALAGGVGLCSGLGYLIRPEALLTVLLAGGLWGLMQKRSQRSWRLTVIAVITTLTVTLLCALPYMMAIGRLTKKKSLSDFAIQSPNQPLAYRTTSLLAAGEYSAPHEFSNQLFEALGPAVGILVCIWLVSYISVRFFGGRRGGGAFIYPQPAGAFMMLGTGLVMAPILMSLYINVGYLVYRHLTFLAALLSPLAGAAVVVMAEFVAKNRVRSDRSEHLKWWALSIITSVVFTGLVVHTLRPLHLGKGYFRRAGEFLEQRTRPGDYLLSDNRWVLHYSQVPGALLKRGAITARELRARIKRSGPTYLALSDESLGRDHTELWAMLSRPEYVQIGRFCPAASQRPKGVRVYHINWDILSQTAGP